MRSNTNTLYLDNQASDASSILGYDERWKEKRDEIFVRRGIRMKVNRCYLHWKTGPSIKYVGAQCFLLVFKDFSEFTDMFKKDAIGKHLPATVLENL